MSNAEGGVMQSDALPTPGRQDAHVRWKHGPDPPVERGRPAGGGGAEPMCAEIAEEVRTGQGKGGCRPTTANLPSGPGLSTDGTGGPEIALTAAADRVSFAAAVKDFDYRTGPAEPNGFNECLDPGVPNGPGDRTGPNDPNGPGDRNASADAGVDANTDRSAILVCTAIRAWNEKPDDDLQPMIPLEEEALAAWMLGGIVLQSPPGFLVCSTRELRGL
ncbi:unnamed protein product [Peronospora destructor]|uniref:Uncharacterized protein n=1 Tax=Peronospora destructor TaxID=86335 RepID=A0AAV0VKA5_9STRA|nr:unnamed protein product [Peronospora destructor]